MSLADDQDYVTKIVEKTERFVVAEMAKIKNDVTLIKNTQSESKAKIANLQSENQQLKAENETLKNQVHTLSREVENIRKHSGEQLLKTLEDSFRAGLMTVLRASKDVDMDITPVLQAMDLPMAASTPKTSDVPSQEFQSPVFPNRLSLYSRKRKSKTSAAPVIITNMDDLNDRIKDYISPYFISDAMASNDKLNNIQRAFVKAKANEVVTTRGPINTSFIRQVISEGEEEHIWPSDFCPSPDIDFEKYMLYRIKNEKKSIQRKQAIASHQERMMGYLEETLSTTSNTVHEGD